MFVSSLNQFYEYIIPSRFGFIFKLVTFECMKGSEADGKYWPKAYTEMPENSY